MASIKQQVQTKAAYTDYAYEKFLIKVIKPPNTYTHLLSKTQQNPEKRFKNRVQPRYTHI